MKEYSIYDPTIKREVNIRVGEDAGENFVLIDTSQKNDIWLHLDEHPSPHVVIETRNKKVCDETIYYAGELCKEHSKLKDEENIRVIYTEIKYVTKTKKLGSVITRNTRRIII